jgi:hypothetical protein
MYSDTVLKVFSQRYSAAKSLFLDSIELSRLMTSTETFNHPEKGPRNERLSCDVIWLGKTNTDNVLVLISGLHGVEGGVGSAIQTDFVNRYKRLPDNCAVVLVHALNPWGFAWASRGDHQGIDVNRNFIDFNQPLPTSDISDLWQQLSSGELDFVDLAADQEQFERISQGQYQHADAPFYGGNTVSWSRQIIESLIEKIAPAKRKKIMVLDIHSGLGGYGCGDLICDHPADSKGFKLAHTLFGKTIVAPFASESKYGAKLGLHDYIWQQQGEHVCFLTLEFGTQGNDRLLSVLAQDQQWQQSGETDWSADSTIETKHAMQDFFCPDEKQWQELVLFRGRQVIEMALAELS